jgi:CRISPR-associated RAMP protein (TIGR02581 family)
MEGLLTTRTGLHIGAGNSGDPLGTDAPVVRNAAGQPFIPGSSLKGVVRSAAEALFRGAGADHKNGKPLWSCNILSKEPCVDEALAKEIRVGFEDSREGAEATWEESCTICRLFGSLALSGRVRFPDLPIVGETFLELRNGVGIDRDKELAAPGVLYDFEAVPPSTSFRLTVVVDNPTKEDVGLILYLFDELDQGNLSIGGKTTRGLGQVRVAWQSIVETNVEKDNPFARLLSKRELLEAPPEYVAPEPTLPLPPSGDPETWRTLAGILREMPRIDKELLGKKAAAHDFTKGNLNDKLGLGLETKRALRKAWDKVLESFVECGLLVETGGEYALASNDAEDATSHDRARHDPALQKLHDEYVGAMAERWQEVFG